MFSNKQISNLVDKQFIGKKSVGGSMTNAKMLNCFFWSIHLLYHLLLCGLIEFNGCLNGESIMLC